MTRLFLIGGFFVAILGVCLGLVLEGLAQDGETTTEASVTAQRGTTEALLLDAEKWTNTAVGRTYTTGTELKTGARSYIEVALDEQNSFRIKGTTQVRVEKIFEASEDEAGKVIRLVELQVIDGEVNARLNDLPDDVRVRVSSPTAVAGASGTGFTVGFNKLKNLSKIKVVESTVVVTAADNPNQRVEVNALEEVEATPWQGGRITASGRGVLSEKLLGEDFVQQFRQGAEEITITATGTGEAPADAVNDDRLTLATQTAADNARANLFAVVVGLSVSETVTVADLLAEDEELSAGLYAAIAALPVVAGELAEDGTFTVTLAITAKDLNEILGRSLPATIASVEELAKADYLATFGAQAAITTKRAATVDGQRRLAERIYGSVLEDNRVLRDVADGPVRITVQGVVRGAVVDEEHYFSDGSVTVVMSCPGDAIAANHGDLVGDTFLSSPSPARLDDFADYRVMHQ